MLCNSCTAEESTSTASLTTDFFKLRMINAALPVVKMPPGVSRGANWVTRDYAMVRYRNVTTWARLQFSVGLKVVAVLPLVIPFSTAHRTALP